MAMLDNTLFGSVGSPGAASGDDDFATLLKRLQMLTSADPNAPALQPGDPNGLGSLLPGMFIQNPPMPASNTAAKSDKGVAAAQNTPATAPTVDSRFLESNSGQKTAPDFNPSWPPFSQQQPPASADKATPYQAFSPFDTTVESTPPVGPSDDQASTPGTVTDNAPSTTTSAQPAAPPGGMSVNGQDAAGPMVDAQTPQYGPGAGLTPSAPPQSSQPTRVAQASTGTMNDGGLPSPSLQNRLAGFFYGLSGVPYDPYTNGPESRQAAYGALIEAGVSPATARAAVMNPKIMDQIVATRLGVKTIPTWGIVGTDAFGNPKYDWINPSTMTIGNGRSAGGGSDTGAANAGGFPKLMGQDGQPLVGNDYIDASGAPPQIADAAKNILAGREAMPAASRGNKSALTTQGLVRAADPTFNANRYGYRQGWEKGTTSIGRTRIANNTAIQHLFELDKMIPDAPDSDAGILSHLSTSAQSWWRRQSNDPWMQDYIANAQTLAGEIVKVNTGAEGSISDREKILSSLDPRNGQASLRRTVAKYIALMAGKTNALARDWKKEMGPYADQPVVVDPENQVMINEMMKAYHVTPANVPAVGTGSAGTQATPTATPNTAAPAPSAGNAPGTAPATQAAPPRGMPAQPPQNAPTTPDGRSYMLNPSFNPKMPEDRNTNPKYWVWPVPTKGQ